ncbi:MAG: helix-turn-helix domain-containing protein [Brachybacterium sp.]|nr:helix-turn-helix domain-containing protein [Brachybacterium sp.]
MLHDERGLLTRGETLIRTASMSIPEAAAELGITEASLRTAIARGSIPAAHILVPDRRVLRILRSHVAARKGRS